ncbi:uncharacterized protein LOC121891969 isoform X2 [Thunnus maccoyii]|uniref:uncharacterized protein LOC121891969 isoform X2 n=1 Tax=Thunnus maccoyii TaxID=8240 RepID=UPI001C4D1C6B|nr:uncharacterized protein LOC121891969 isoform X2 [Thunnus maccoyii]
MAVWKLWFVLLLLLPAYNNSQVTIVKTTGREPYVTPICTNETLNIITLIICKIRTERSRGEECRLMYKYGQDFEHGCDSRFTLMKKNQTVFLHLTSLTPVDSGNYSCECVYPGVTNTLHLHITVEETVQEQTHLDHLYVNLPAHRTKMTQMTPTQAFSSQQIISTKLSPQ